MDRESVRAQLISSGVIGNDAYVVLGMLLSPRRLRNLVTIVHFSSQLARPTRTLTMLLPVKSTESSATKEHLPFTAHVSFKESIRNRVNDVAHCRVNSVTLEAYQNLYTGLVSYLGDGATTSPPTGPIPEDLTKKAISLQVRYTYPEQGCV